MGILNLFVASSMPVLKVLLVTAVGSFLALDPINLLGEDARKHLNSIVFYVLNPALISSNLAKTITYENLVKLWFMPINILITFIVGSVLGWVVNLLTRPPPHLRGLVIGCCAAGNLGNILIIILPAVCKEKGTPFGDPDICSTYALAYASLSMALGAVCLWVYVYNILRISAQSSSKEVNGSSVCKSTSESSIAQPESFTEPLLSPKDLIASEDHANALPCTRFDEKPQLTFTNKIKQHVVELSRKLNLKKLFAPSTNGAIVGFTVGLIPAIRKSMIGTLSLLIGVSGVIFSLFAIFHRRPIPTFRCGRVEDTFRAFYSLPNARRLGGDSGTGNIADRPKFLGFVGIQTGFGSGDRRKALRSTWFPSDPDGLLRLEQATGLAFRFVIGRTKDAKKMAELEKEIEKHNDFMIIDVEEEYLKLKYKTLAYFKAAFQLFEADYYVKADDDIYLRPDRLATILAKERTHTLTYIGCMKKGPVVTNPKMKWYEKSANLIGNEYFLHAYGPIYVLSAEVVASLAVARNNSLRMFNNEDVTIGSWMLAMNVHHEDNRAICDPRCTPTSIAVWDIPKCSGLCNPTTKMKALHNNSMCSKSPTLPPDDR